MPLLAHPFSFFSRYRASVAACALALCVPAWSQLAVPVAPAITAAPGGAGAGAAGSAASTGINAGSASAGPNASMAAPRGDAVDTLSAPKNIMQQGNNAEATSKEAAKPDTSPNPKSPDSKANAADSKDPLAAEPVKEAKLEDTEFQRFVFNATGKALALYGYDIFNRSNTFSPAQAAPVPADYVLGPGDEIAIHINGLMEVSQTFVIDRDGRIMLPKVGPVSLAGVALNRAETVLTGQIAKVLRNFTVSVSMGRLRSIEVFVVGQARHPGKHLVSSMSGLVNALLETGGPGANGSMRAIELRRGGKTIATLDMYAFLAQGDSSADVALMARDILYIPPAGERAALLGTINAPAIYEIKNNETIAQMLALSGGLPALAAPQKAQLERVDASRDVARYVEDFALDAKGLKQTLKAGDILTVFQISPQISNAVTLEGNVAAPLRYTFRPGMRVSDLLLDKRLLIPGSYWMQVNRGSSAGSYARPEVNIDYATVQRLNPETLQTEILAFDLAKAIALDPIENMELRSGDIIKVYAPTDPGPVTENSITITGESVGGTHRFAWRAGHTVAKYAERINELFAQASRTRAADAQVEQEQVLYSSYPVNLGYATVLRRDPDSLRSTLIAFNLGKALAGDSTEALALQSRDSITIYSPKQLGPETLDAVTVAGEIVGGKQRYVWREGMTVRDIIPSTQWLVDTYNYWQRASGRTLNNDINWDYAQVLRRIPSTLQSKAITFDLGRAVLDGNPKDNIRLEPGDQIALFTTAQLPVPAEKRAHVVTLSGEVMVPGKYQVEPDETLPQVIQRAGGLSRRAYLYGMVFSRESTRVQQQVNLDKSLKQMQSDINAQAATALQNVTDTTEKGSNVQAQLAGQRIMLERLQGIKATGRIALDLDPEKPVLPPVTLEDGDQVIIPMRPSFVGVFGEVFTDSAVLHKPHNTVADYLGKAGVTREADMDNLIIVRADGKVESSPASFFTMSSAILGKHLYPGDSVFVPGRVDRRTAYSAFIQGAKDWTAILYQFGLGAAGFKTLK